MFPSDYDPMVPDSRELAAEAQYDSEAEQALEAFESSQAYEQAAAYEDGLHDDPWGGYEDPGVPFEL